MCVQIGGVEEGAGESSFGLRVGAHQDEILSAGSVLDDFRAESSVTAEEVF